MTRRHLDRLTSTDASFLQRETASAHMHIGGLLLFEGPAPALGALRNHVRRRLHLVPRYRQKLVFPPRGGGRPLWIDDHEFELEWHVRQASLPAPGDEDLLTELAASIASRPLDRRRPLWELWLVDGIRPATGATVERFAMVAKHHHALVDGISGVDLATVLLDLTPEPPRPDTTGLRPWRAQRPPDSLELLCAGVRDGMRAAISLTTLTARALATPRRSATALSEAGTGLSALLAELGRPAPRTPLNVPIGPQRRLRVVSQRLDDYRAIKSSAGVSVNDVVLTVVAGAAGEWLRSRAYDTDGLELRALVPVSLRAAEERGTLGNRLALMRGPLPVGITDPVRRLRTVSRAMDGLKRSKQAVGAAALAAMSDRLPPAVLAQASRLQFSPWLFNLLVTNVPGPQVPLYIMGKRLTDLIPVAFLPAGHALAVAVMSYDGRIAYGLLGDHASLPDMDVLAGGIDQSLAQLYDAVGALA